jgi:hypothetical protein
MLFKDAKCSLHTITYQHVPVGLYPWQQILVEWLELIAHGNLAIIFDGENDRIVWNVFLSVLGVDRVRPPTRIRLLDDRESPPSTWFPDAAQG